MITRRPFRAAFSVSFRHFNTLFTPCQSRPVGGLYKAENIYNCKISFVLDNFYDIISANICYVEEACYEYRKNCITLSEEEIALKGDSYTVFVREDYDTVIADVFMPQVDE